MNVNTVTTYDLSSLGLMVRHNHGADIVTIENSVQDPYDTPLMFPWLERDQRLELVKALLATLAPDTAEIVPVTLLDYEGLAQDDFDIYVTKTGALAIEFKEPYDDDAETHSTVFVGDQAVTLAKIILARHQQKE